MIVNDLQRLRWQILDECLRDTDVEYFMGGARKENETETIKCLLNQVNRRLKEFRHNYKCSKRQLQLDIDLFEKKGGRLEPRYRRGHKRILRLMNLQWKNPLLKEAITLSKTVTGNLTSLLNIPGEECLSMHLHGIAQEEIGQDVLIFNTTISDDTVRILLGYGADVDVVTPASLRQQILEKARATVEVYGREAKPISNRDEKDIVTEPAETCNSIEENENVERPILSFSDAQKPPTQNDAPQAETATEKSEPIAKPEQKHQAGEQLNLFDLFG